MAYKGELGVGKSPMLAGANSRAQKEIK